MATAASAPTWYSAYFSAIGLLIVCVLAVTLLILWYRRIPNVSPVVGQRSFSFQSGLGIFLFSFFLSIDTLALILLAESSAIAAAELAGVGIIFFDILIFIILIPVYAVILKRLRVFMQAAGWDLYLLYPFTALNIVALIFWVTQWRSWI